MNIKKLIEEVAAIKVADRNAIANFNDRYSVEELQKTIHFLRGEYQNKFLSSFFKKMRIFMYHRVISMKQTDYRIDYCKLFEKELDDIIKLGETNV